MTEPRAVVAAPGSLRFFDLFCSVDSLVQTRRKVKLGRGGIFGQVDFPTRNPPLSLLLPTGRLLLRTSSLRRPATLRNDDRNLPMSRFLFYLLRFSCFGRHDQRAFLRQIPQQVRGRPELLCAKAALEPKGKKQQTTAPAAVMTRTKLHDTKRAGHARKRQQEELSSY